MEFLLQIDSKRSAPTGKKVAIIGGGPAGLSAAIELFKSGHEVHVYDKMPEPGGLLLFGMPDYRIDKEKVRETVRKLKGLGIVFYTNKNVGNDVHLSEIIKGYDAVLVATGAWENNRLCVPGESLDGIYYAFDYIIKYHLLKLGYSDVNLPKLYGHVAVIGGGLTAVDACHIAQQGKVDSITLIYRRGKGQAPAGRKIIENLEASGVKVLEYTQPIEFLEELGRVKMIKAVKTKLLGDRESCRLNMIEGSEHLIPADNVLIAVGLKPSIPSNGSSFHLEIMKDGRTSFENVFIAGDALLGPSYVGFALRSGKKAAEQINAYLHKK
ncbi:MAG: FAD-dependent oxidoreductase [Nitrososphaeria archaeon]